MVGVRDLPIVGPWIGKVGKINAILAAPCGGSFDIWVTAAWTASPVLFTSLFKPDLVSTITGVFSPPGAKPGKPGKIPHHRRRRYRAKGWVRHNPNSFFGGSGKSLYVPQTALTTAVWRIFVAQQTIGFYVLVANASADFLIEWTSLAMTASGCDQQSNLIAKGEVEAGTLHGATGSYSAVFWQTIVDAPGVQFTNHVRIDAGLAVGLGIGWKIRRSIFCTSEETMQVEARVIDADDGTVYDFKGPLDLKQGEEGGFGVLAIIPSRDVGFRDLIPQLKVSGCIAEIGGSHASVIGLPQVSPFTITADP